MHDSRERDERIRQALQLLGDEIRERIDRHPLGHLVAGRGEKIDLRLSLPTFFKDGQLEKASQSAAESIQEAVQALLHHNAVFQPGRVLCLRCETSTCEHAAPTNSRQVFAGWGKTGLPRFVDFGQWLLERRDPKVDLLYREPSPLVVTVVPEADLVGGLIDVYRQEREGSYRVHGQVTAGWYRAPDPSGLAGVRQPLAVSLQVVSSKSRRLRQRFGVNVIGVGPGGEPLENLYDRIGAVPWGDAVRWAQSALSGIETKLERSRMPREVLEQRLDGIVQGMARRLEKDWRGKERRTAHGQQRHAEGDRPTRMALTDLARAKPENLLFDTRRETLVVVGDRGRAHVFNLAGKLVTSVRYNPTAIEKRRQTGIWRPAAAEEVRTVRERVEAGPVEA